MSDTHTDYDEPVAYDKDGRPLYAHPPKKTIGSKVAEQVVHVARPADPVSQPISEETAKKHSDSVAKYPALNLSKEEYVISEVRRHPIGLAMPIAIAAVLLIAVIGGLMNYSWLVPSGVPSLASLLLPALLVVLLICIGLYIAVWVYMNNRFYLTNESVIQEIQLTLFSRNEQTVSLSNIEDASFTQTGIFQMMLNYGSIRLSTEGDETTYRFQYVSNPKREIALLNNAVEAFKNGRPVAD